MKLKRKGDRGSPWRVPRLISIGEVWPRGITNSVDAPLYRFETRRVKSLRIPKNFRGVMLDRDPRELAVLRESRNGDVAGGEGFPESSV